MKTDGLLFADRRRLTGPSLRSFWEIAHLWALSEDEQIILLGISRSATLHRWRNGEVKALKHDVLVRLSLLFGIFRALNQLLGSSSRSAEWLRKRNAAPLFGGKSALELMLSGRVEDLHATRRYLEAQLYR